MIGRLFCTIGLHRERCVECFDHDERDDVIYALRCARCSRPRLSVGGIDPRCFKDPLSPSLRTNHLAARTWMAAIVGPAGRHAPIWWT